MQIYVWKKEGSDQIQGPSCAWCVRRNTPEECGVHRGGKILSIQLETRLLYCEKKCIGSITTANTILLNLDKMQIESRKTRTIYYCKSNFDT